MLVREVLEEEKEQYNKVVNHPLQSWQWGEFRQKTGLKVIRLGYFEERKITSGFQLTIHPIPYTEFTIGYLPKGPLPDEPMLDSLKKIGKKENCIFIKLEPNIGPHPKTHEFLIKNGCQIGRPLFTQYTFIIDLEKSEEELFSQLKEKTRYNVRLAQKNGVIVKKDNSPQAFEEYLKLSKETAARQHFYTHDENYHRLMWKTLQPAGIAHLFLAYPPNPSNPPNSPFSSPLAAWILFLFHDTLYYPYGASSNKNRELMASNLMMWQAIRWGKGNGAKKFDLWGALEPNPNPKDPWFGFHRFKEGYNPVLSEFIGSYDFVLNPILYSIYNVLDKLRWVYLNSKSYLPL